HRSQGRPRHEPGPPLRHLEVPAAVHPGAQGTGLGRLLLTFVEERARARGLPEVRLLTHALMRENQQMYERYGYEVDERRTADDPDRVHYRKPVS
ncbi:GNAT family N-acetyltransferase, partial [Streptomyces sp. NPDC000229]|uniref:GNAT family N-acetyltransferase n=1 Tax=Streptomyces sp. NPDC000229 TaxID=3154247 RepID=UPI0033224163